MNAIDADADHDPMIPSLFRVREKKEERPQVVTLHLSPEDGSPTPPFQPGQFNMLYIFGRGEIPISMSGSLRGAPGETWVSHTIRDVGKVSEGLCQLQPGDLVGLRGPFGRPWPAPGTLSTQKNILLVAGGLGIAPLRPAMIQFLESKGKEKQTLHLLYGAKTPDDILYQEDLRLWGKEEGVHLWITVDKASPSWKGPVGLVGQFFPLIFSQTSPQQSAALICGPEGMMNSVAQDLLRHGLPEESLFLSLERNMKCAIAHCGRCQLGPHFVCQDGPIFTWAQIEELMLVPEV